MINVSTNNEVSTSGGAPYSNHLCNDTCPARFISLLHPPNHPQFIKQGLQDALTPASIALSVSPSLSYSNRFIFLFRHHNAIIVRPLKGSRGAGFFGQNSVMVLVRVKSIEHIFVIEMAFLVVTLQRHLPLNRYLLLSSIVSFMVWQG